MDLTQRLHNRFVDREPYRDMSVKDIVADWLRAHGYDGLYTDDCGCGLVDLMPCDSAEPTCKPARKYVCACGDHWYGPPDSETTDCPVCREDDSENDH